MVYDYPADYVAVEEVPPTIYYEPYVYYYGHPAYLVDGRWYYRYDSRWVVFREEPRELREYRVRYPARMYRRRHVPAEFGAPPRRRRYYP